MKIQKGTLEGKEIQRNIGPAPAFTACHGSTARCRDLWVVMAVL